MLQAGSERSLQQLARAEQILLEVLQAKRRCLGLSHWDTLVSVDNLVGAFLNHGLFGKAEIVYRDHLALLKKSAGGSSETTEAILAMLDGVGDMLVQQEKWKVSANDGVAVRFSSPPLSLP